MKTTRDSLLWISVLLAVTGGLQASTGFLSDLAEKYPIAFGVAMTAISVTTGVLTVLRTLKTQQLEEEKVNGKD
jgi:hypothetical protein